MEVDVKMTGFDQVMLELQNIGEKVPAKARKTMHRTADQIVKLAQRQAPVDKHNLEESIHKEIGYQDNRRLKIDIVAGGTVNGVNVDEYAMRIHEDYSSMKPGKGTLAKMAANPDVLIGEKFLERAYDKYSDKLEADLIENVAKEKIDL